MGLLSPLWLLAGAAAAALPLWLHMLQQHKQDPLEFASTMLLERTTDSTTYQRRLKYRLLMALRILLLLLLALAFAQPFLRKPPAILNAANVLNIVVIDNSFSMREGTRLEQARREAVNALPSNGMAQIWSSGSHTTVLSPITKDRAELTAAIQSVAATDEKSSFAELARSLRDAARSANRPVKAVFITDAQRTAMPPSFADLTLEMGSQLKIVSLGAKLPNYTVETVNSPRTVSDLSNAKVNATITAFNAPAEKRSVTLVVNGKRLSTKVVEVPENGRAAVEFTGIEGPYGWLKGEVVIDDVDAIADDNRFHFSVERADPRKVLLLEEQRGSKASLYFKAALESTAQAFFAVEEMSAASAATANLTGYAFVVLHDPGVNIKAIEGKLKQFVESGGALWIAAGPQAGGMPAIPVAGYKVDGSNVAQRDTQRYFAAANVDPTHPSLRRAGRFEGVRFFQSVRVEAPAGAQVAAKLEDGSPLLIEQKVGEGKVLTFTSSFDNATNDLPVKPSFVPFVEQSAAYLGRVEDRNTSYAVDSYLDLRADRERASSVEVIGPKGERALSLKEAATANSLRLTDSGFYDVRRENGRQELIAVNVDRRESDLDPETAENLKLWEGTGANSGSASQAGTLEAPNPEPQSFWWWVALLAFVALLAESFLSARYLQART